MRRRTFLSGVSVLAISFMLPPVTIGEPLDPNLSTIVKYVRQSLAISSPGDRALLFEYAASTYKNMVGSVPEWRDDQALIGITRQALDTLFAQFPTIEKREDTTLLREDNSLNIAGQVAALYALPIRPDVCDKPLILALSAYAQARLAV